MGAQGLGCAGCEQGVGCNVKVVGLVGGGAVGVANWHGCCLGSTGVPEHFVFHSRIMHRGQGIAVAAHT